jgi:hypothetical protein
VLQQFPSSPVLTVARHETVVVAVPSTVHYPTNYKIKIFQVKFESVNKPFTLIIPQIALKYLHMKYSLTATPFFKWKHLNRR